ncbi:hypothetical protein B0H11DRAFT_2240893 [Mycena galericulata]|nr:hypothetical protein B0H11DRAFT_2240893 [Mycena galericulata]
MADWALKSDRATVVITSTAQPEHRYQTFQPDDLGGIIIGPTPICRLRLPWQSQFKALFLGSLSCTMWKIMVSIIPGPYVNGAGTRLDSNFKGEIVDHLQETYPELHDPLKLQAFIKRWRYMFAYAAVGYARAYTSLMCWTLT